MPFIIIFGLRSHVYCNLPTTNIDYSNSNFFSMCDCSAQISKCYLQTSLCLVYLQLFITVKLKLKLTFYFVVKCLISIFKFCDSSNLLFFL